MSHVCVSGVRKWYRILLKLVLDQTKNKLSEMKQRSTKFYSEAACGKNTKNKTCELKQPYRQKVLFLIKYVVFPQ